MFETSGSFIQTSRQTDIWAISPIYLNTTHPVHIITALLNCTNWWRKTQCPTFVCFFSFHIPFCPSLHVLAISSVKKKRKAYFKHWSGCFSGGSERAQSPFSNKCLRNKYKQTQLGQKGASDLDVTFAPLGICKTSQHYWIVLCLSLLTSTDDLIWICTLSLYLYLSYTFLSVLSLRIYRGIFSCGIFCLKSSLYSWKYSFKRPCTSRLKMENSFSCD